MPVRGSRGTFAAATFTVAVLAAVGIFAKCARVLIPPPPPNDLAGSEAPFLSRAGTQSVHWRTTDMQPFAEARRLDKPVMVFAGTASGQAARRFDDEIFANLEVAARLNRDFVCVRVDFSVEPEWRCAFLAKLRSEVGADPSYVLLFFKPDGELLTWIGRRDWDDRPDYNDFLGRLQEIVQQWRDAVPGTWSQSEREQHEERVAIRSGAVRQLVDVDAFLDALAQRRTFFQWQAGRYRVLLQRGMDADLALVLKAELATPRVDLVDGGFFRIGSGLDPRLVEFDKVATMNADMAAVLADAFKTTDEPLFRYMYERTMDCIAEQFASGARWSSSVEHAVEPDGRCRRNSFGVSDARTRFSPALKAMAERLGLDPRENPFMVPYLRDPGALLKDPAVLGSAVEELQRLGDKSVLTPSEDDSLDSAGFVVARCIQAASAMHDQARLDKALAWARALSRFRAGTNEVRHSTHGRGTARKWLGDYTSYADAMFEAFVATRDEDFLRRGEPVLRRALELYTRADPGDVVAVSSLQRLEGGPDLEMPSLVDDGRPPALPWLMALCFRYGAVLGDPGLRSVAVAIAERYGAVANSSPSTFPTFFANANEVLTVGCVVFAGQASPTVPRTVRALPAASTNKEATGPVRYVRNGFEPAQG